MGNKPARKPVWWKNTFFWFAFALFAVAMVGIPLGEGAIRDPGQVREGGIIWIYLLSAVVMFANGWITHRQGLQAYGELEDRGAHD